MKARKLLKRALALGASRPNKALKYLDMALKMDPSLEEARIAKKRIQEGSPLTVEESGQDSNRSSRTSPMPKDAKRRRADVASIARSMTEGMVRNGLLPSPTFEYADGLSKGNRLASQGKYEEALKCYKEGAEAAERIPSSLYPVGMTLIRLGRWKEAEETLKEMIEGMPDLSGPFALLVRVYARLGDDEKSQNCYELALSRNSGSHLAHKCYGDALMDSGRYGEALKYYTKAVQTTPGRAGLENDVGRALESLGRSREALEQYRTAAKTDPNFWEAPYNAGRLLAAEGRYDEAVGALQESLQINPEFGPARSLMAEAAESRSGAGEAPAEGLEMGADYDAEASYAEAIARLETGQFTGVLHYLILAKKGGMRGAPIEFHIGESLMINGYDLEAIHQYHLAIKMKPDDARYFIALANLLCKLDRMEEAQAEYEKAISLDDDPGIPQMAADTMRRSGYFQEALDMCAKALNANPDDDELIRQRDLIMEEMEE